MTNTTQTLEQTSTQEIVKGIKICHKLADQFRWAACKHDGVDPDEAFVVFSEGNPFVGRMDDAIGDFIKHLAVLKSRNILQG